MSKCGRKEISCNGVQIEIENNIVSYKGKEASGQYVIPEIFNIIKEKHTIFISPKEDLKIKKNDVNRLWGLHRALLGNAIAGANSLFEKKVKIEGLGYKAQKQDNKIIFTLGFSHKIEYEIKNGVSVEIDKAGQLISVKSHDKELLGFVCSEIRAFRPVEPYKGKGIRYENEVILRKEGKKK